MVLCFVGLGGNFAGSLEALEVALERLEASFDGFVCSRFYRTSPVCCEGGGDFFNCACRFETSLDVKALWDCLQRLESDLGKVCKAKNASRLIDIDLLFYGDVVDSFGDLVVPHPRWHERLFVLAPLAEIATLLPLGIDVAEMMQKFSNPHGEVVECLN